MSYAVVSHNHARLAAEGDGLVNVLAEVRVEHVLERTRIAVIVFRGHYDERIGARLFYDGAAFDQPF